MPVVLGYLAVRDMVALLVLGLLLGVLVAVLLVSHVVRVRQRTLWIAFVFVIVAAAVLWDGIEVRFEDVTGAVYWRTDWDWEDAGGGVTEWISYIALVVGPAIASAFAYTAVVRAGFRRLSQRRWRILLAAIAAPFAVVLAAGLILGILEHPLLFYSERSS